MELLYPLGLLAAAGIIVPVLIHLWHKKQRKVLRVGSIKLFGHGKKQRINKLRIKNWPLFLLRCLLILLLSFLLASPYIPYLDRGATRGVGWVLLGAGHQEGLDSAQSKQIDSLLGQGYALHAFDVGFEKITVEDTVAPTGNYFSLIHQLNTNLPDGFPVVLYTRGRIGDLKGDAPSTKLDLHWDVFSRVDSSAVRWVQHAWNTKDGGIAVTIGRSLPTGTGFERMVLQDDGRGQGLQLRVEQGAAQIKLEEQDEWVGVREGRLRVQFATDRSLQDMHYIKALLAAFEEGMGYTLEVTDYDPKVACDILFDLTDNGTTNWEHSPRAIFRYMPGKAEGQGPNAIVQTDFRANSEKAKLSQMVIAADDKGKLLWSDAYGRPLLTSTFQDSSVLFQFYSRFDPGWTDLVWSDEMLNSMIPLLSDPEQPLIGNSFSTSGMDKRAIFTKINLEKWSKNDSIATIQEKKEPNGTEILAWLAIMLFVLERVLTYSNIRKKNYG